ncbi:hypothetical protein OIU84_001847 [Salix udensis]|uniref:Uncharacterized protein n=1 Tax=Salix udensis TaxID=889485 RepID=A0AAD6K7S5_9ROSI|nr:hypothetical protein OIU84_001847 [Salix udensis]
MEREEQSLSLSTPFCEGNGVGVDEKGNQERGISKKEILEEVKKQLWLSGHLGELSLAGASMGHFLCELSLVSACWESNSSTRTVSTADLAVCDGC